MPFKQQDIPVSMTTSSASQRKLLLNVMEKIRRRVNYWPIKFITLFLMMYANKHNEIQPLQCWEIR